MNDLSSNNNNTTTTPSSTNSNISNLNNLTTIIPSVSSSINSNSLILSPGSISPAGNTDRLRGNKKLKHIVQISSMFGSMSSSSTAQYKIEETSKLSELLNSYLKELPKLPEELNVKTCDPVILDFEPDWNKYVGEAFAQVIL